ncbi:MAG: tetratricopeptide repeat protein [Spirochaetales bacterium]|jgi:tetratricopeptide (TPR) repeat protein|nr:tetratricopeptide repeat protein [Spirochaetales bacterium]
MIHLFRLNLIPPNMVRRFLWLCAAGLVCAACSSVPDAHPEEVFEKRNQAARNLESGNRYFREARYNEALEFYRLSLDAYTALDETGGRIRALNSIGKVFFLAGEDDKALDYYNRALALSRGYDDPVSLLQSANNIGEFELRRGNSGRALTIYREALEDERVSDSMLVELAILYHNMGAFLRDTGEYEEALGCVRKAADMNRAEKRFTELAANYYLFSSIYFRQNLLDQARENAFAALDYDRRMENSLGIAQDLLALGSIAQKAGDTGEAHNSYKRAFLAYRANGYVRGMRTSLEKLIDTSTRLNLEEEEKQYREAYGQLQPKT